jgi:CubicO group peptidase (beta-lactamase class C family)
VDTVAIEHALDDVVGAIRSVYAVPGLAVAVTDREGLIVERCYGHADVAAGRPVTSDTMFEIGSIGKSFTACCVMQLVEEGRLDLNLKMLDLVQQVAEAPLPPPGVGAAGRGPSAHAGRALRRRDPARA